MLYYIKKYPVSLVIILAVIYLSFFKPPTTDLGTIPNLDKVVHICMYFGMSGMLWLEFLRAHRRDRTPMWHAWVGAFVCPVLFSGAVELLRHFVLPTVAAIGWILQPIPRGTALASLVACFVLKPRVMRKSTD